MANALYSLIPTQPIASLPLGRGFFVVFVGFTNAGIEDVGSGLRSPEQTTVVAHYGDGDDHGPSPDCVKFCMRTHMSHL